MSLDVCRKIRFVLCQDLRAYRAWCIDNRIAFFNQLHLIDKGNTICPRQEKHCRGVYVSEIILYEAWYKYKDNFAIYELLQHQLKRSV